MNASCQQTLPLLIVTFVLHNCCDCCYSCYFFLPELSVSMRVLQLMTV